MQPAMTFLRRQCRKRLSFTEVAVENQVIFCILRNDAKAKMILIFLIEKEKRQSERSAGKIKVKSNLTFYDIRNLKNHRCCANNTNVLSRETYKL